MFRHTIFVATLLLFFGSAAWPDSAAKSADEYDPTDIEDFAGLVGLREERFVRDLSNYIKVHYGNYFSEAPDAVQEIINEELDSVTMIIFNETVEPTVVRVIKEYFSPEEINEYLDGEIETLEKMPAFWQALKAELDVEIPAEMSYMAGELWSAADRRLVDAGYQRTRVYAKFGAAVVPGSVSSSADRAPDVEYASPAEIPSAVFVKDPMGGVLLSDDGEHVALLYRDGDRYQIVTRRTDDPESPGIVHSRPLKNRVHQVEWLSDNTLVLDRKGSSFRAVDGRFVTDSYHRVSTIEVGKSGMTDIVSIDHQSPQSYSSRTIVDLIPGNPDQILIAYSPDGKNYPGVFKLHLSSGQFDVVQPSKPPIQNWWSDAHSIVRLGMGVADGKVVVIARAGTDSIWETLSNNKVFLPGRFDIVGFDVEPSMVLVKSSVSSGRSEIYRMSLTSGRLVEKVFDHPKVDAADIVVSRRDQRLLAIGFVDTQHEYRYFDSDFAESMEFVDQELPGRSNMIRSISSDDNFLLIYSVSGVHPGSFHSFDRRNRILRLIEANNPSLDSKNLAPVRVVNYFARDGLEIPAYVTVPRSYSGEALPAIVMPHDISEGRDTLEFNFMAQFLASRGYVVIQPNFRGSTGYGALFQGMGRGEWGDKMQADVADAAQFLVEEGLADPARICAVGWSYGGYAALMSVIQDPKSFACAVAIAPITNLENTLKTLKMSVGDAAVESIVGNKKGRKIRAISPIHRIKSLDRPVLIMHGTNDKVVSFNDSIAFVQKLVKYKKPHDSVTLFGADHTLSDAKHRAAMLDRMEVFLSKQIGVSSQ